ncbi:MAG: TatD family hydrolase [Candidatus Gastranaerophilales bacterium]|nr:TatD family hydrolase [Candidatus Gastranaerophilales bacterium]
MIDTHAHIDMDCYKEDFEKVLARAKANGIEKIIIPAAAEKDFDKIINLAEKYDNIYAAIGVHPEDAKLYTEKSHDKIIQLAKHKKVIAIGEIGLDYYWDKTTIDIQQKIFKDQIEIAKAVNKPILVHDRDAHEDSFNIIKNTNAGAIDVVMHCFSGSVEFAKQCINEGWYIALGGVTTFKNAKKAKEVAKIVPLDKLLLETDSPYMTPTPHRGEQNEPAFVKFVAIEIANLRNVTLEEIDNTTTDNACRIFDFGGYNE